MCWKLNWLKNTKKIWVANFFHKIHLKEGQKSTNIEFWINSLSIMGPQNEAFEKMVAVDRRSTFWKRWSVHSYNGHVHRASRQQWIMIARSCYYTYVGGCGSLKLIFPFPGATVWLWSGVFVWPHTESSTLQPHTHVLASTGDWSMSWA